MIYYISMLSTTGGKLKISPKILKSYNKIKKINPKKHSNRFRTNKTIASLKKADGLVVWKPIM